ncbi:MAG TPA: hypothetical protein ENH85_00795 [Candidatus Scalindua sp.]|nr:hypothetical protein [Candidatus Scalindua sp.]
MAGPKCQKTKREREKSKAVAKKAKEIVKPIPKDDKKNRILVQMMDLEDGGVTRGMMASDITEEHGLSKSTFNKYYSEMSAFRLEVLDLAPIKQRYARRMAQRANLYSKAVNTNQLRLALDILKDIDKLEGFYDMLQEEDKPLSITIAEEDLRLLIEMNAKRPPIIQAEEMKNVN